MELGEAESALEAFQHALAIDADHLFAQYNLARALLDLGDYTDALDAAQSTLGLAPEDRKGEVLGLIGDIRMRQGFLAEAEDSLREAIRHDGSAVTPRFLLANLRHELGRDEDAVQLFEEIVTMNPDHQDAYIDLAFTFRSLGRYFDALAAMHRGVELGRFHPGWAHSSGQWVKECETMIEMDHRLDAYMKGQVALDDPKEQILLALVCAARGFPTTAAWHFYSALSAQPELGDDVFRAYWFQAAGAAAKASAGEGNDGEGLNDDEKRRLTRLALECLDKDLVIWKKTASYGNMGNFTIQRALAVRKLHPALHAVRDPDALASLPGDVHESFEQYWARVEELLMVDEE
jgi:tetratricopeptide (TPR) repeat protein